MKLHRYVDHQRLHIVTKDVISLSISVLLLFRHYISHKITFGAPSSGGVLRSACGAFILKTFTLRPIFSVLFKFISVFVDSCEPATEGPETEQPDPLDEGDKSEVGFSS